MGFDELLTREALAATGNIDAAMEYLIALLS